MKIVHVVGFLLGWALCSGVRALVPPEAAVQQCSQGILAISVALILYIVSQEKN